jgi:hypothetical protein
MDKVTFIEITDPASNEVKEHAIIEHPDGSFTSMLKATYDAMQAEQSTPSVTNGD